MTKADDKGKEPDQNGQGLIPTSYTPSSGLGPRAQILFVLPICTA